jgi:hypothetical protein
VNCADDIREKDRINSVPACVGFRSGAEAGENRLSGANAALGTRDSSRRAAKVRGRETAAVWPHRSYHAVALRPEGRLVLPTQIPLHSPCRRRREESLTKEWADCGGQRIRLTPVPSRFLH